MGRTGAQGTEYPYSIRNPEIFNEQESKYFYLQKKSESVLDEQCH